MKAILLLSGGIDSTTVLAQLASQNFDVVALIFDYGQTLVKEIDIAQSNALTYNTLSLIINTPLDWLPGHCSILGTDDSQIVTGRTIKQIEQGGTPSSYVPFRNGIFLAYAVAYGEAAGIENIYCGGNGLNSGNYWDDTVGFAAKFQQAARQGTSPDYQPKIIFPFASVTKAEIVKAGLRLGVNYNQTWSCYKSGDNHCGICDSCVQRRIALGGN